MHLFVVLFLFFFLFLVLINELKQECNFCWGTQSPFILKLLSNSWPAFKESYFSRFLQYKAGKSIPTTNTNFRECNFAGILSGFCVSHCLNSYFTDCFCTLQLWLQQVLQTETLANATLQGNLVLHSSFTE